MIINGAEYIFKEPMQAENIEYWYSRQDKSWVIQVNSKEKYEIESRYVYSKTERDNIVEDYKKEYKINKVVHWK